MNFMNFKDSFTIDWCLMTWIGILSKYTEKQAVTNHALFWTVLNETVQWTFFPDNGWLRFKQADSLVSGTSDGGRRLAIVIFTIDKLESFHFLLVCVFRDLEWELNLMEIGLHIPYDFIYIQREEPFDSNVWHHTFHCS